MLTIRMMGDFSITVDGKEPYYLISKTKKGVALLEYLILHQGKPVQKQRLLHVLWSEGNANPENAMKTLISRLRKQLDEIRQGLGACIVSARGSYHWESLPGMKIDLLELMRIFEELPREKDEDKRCSRYRQLMRLYSGDLFLTGDIEGGEEYQAALHRAYVNSIYDYIEILLKKQEYGQIVEACEKVLRIAPYDERFSMELNHARAKTSPSGAAMTAYREQRGLESTEEEKEYGLWDSYYGVLESNNTLQSQLDSIVAGLQEKRSQKGAYLCDSEEFGRFYRLLMPTLERLGCPMFLGMISLQMYNPSDYSEDIRGEQKKAMKNLMEILRENLRQGDVVTSDFQTTVMVLLPAVNYTTGNMIMERIRYQFFEKNAGTKVPFHYRLREIRE